MDISIRLGNSGSEMASHFNGTKSPRLINSNFKSSNRHDVSIVWLDTRIDPNDLHIQHLLNQLNDRVELYTDIRACLNFLYECYETILLILSGKCASQCLSSIHSLSSVDSIIIYCASPQKYRHLLNNNIKIWNCITTEADLIQSVHTWIDLKCQTHAYTWKSSANDSKTLTRQTALFLANHLLSKCIDNSSYWVRKTEMLNICREYYGQRQSELEHIQEFELTYVATDAIMWYTRDSFVHKIVNRVLRSFDNVKLQIIGFYIQDLRRQLQELRLTSLEQPKVVYHGLVMTSTDINRIQAVSIGSLLSTNGFLSTSRNYEIAMAFANKRQKTVGQPLSNVLFEINLDITDSPVVFADIGHISIFADEDEVLFDIGTILCIKKVDYDDSSQFCLIKLSIATQNEYDSVEKLLKSVKFQFDEESDKHEYAYLIGKLLSVNSQLNEELKKHNDRWQKFSLFQSAFNSLWHSGYDPYKDWFHEYLPLFSKFIKSSFHHHSNKHEKLNMIKTKNLIENNERSTANLEPVIFFYVNNELMKNERENFSKIFSLQYRRFIQNHLTFEQMEANLEEFHAIFYISPELPVYMQNNNRVKFYEFNISQENQDPTGMILLKERLISKLLNDLGIFYYEQSKILSDDPSNSIIKKKLLAKGEKCYCQLEIEMERTLQRYAQADEADQNFKSGL